MRRITITALALLCPGTGVSQANPPESVLLRHRVAVLTEFSAINWVMRPSDRLVPVSAEFGPVLYLGRKHGAGWTLLFDATRDLPFVGTGPRYRRLLGRDFAVDAGVNVRVTDRPGRIVLKLAGGYRDLAGVHARIDYSGDEGVAWGVGAHLGGAPGLVATGLTTALLGIGLTIRVLHSAGYRDP